MTIDHIATLHRIHAEAIEELIREHKEQDMQSEEPLLILGAERTPYTAPSMTPYAIVLAATAIACLALSFVMAEPASVQELQPADVVREMPQDTLAGDVPR